MEQIEFGEMRTDLDGSQRSLMQQGPEILIELSDYSQPSSGHQYLEPPKLIAKHIPE